MSGRWTSPAWWGCEVNQLLTLLVAVVLSTGCRGDFLKQVESGAYDQAAKTVSVYCEHMDSSLAQQERLEARREIRQRGLNGPAAVSVEGLDDQTAGGHGPVVRIYCHGETVPVRVWEDLKK